MKKRTLLALTTCSMLLLLLLVLLCTPLGSGIGAGTEKAPQFSIAFEKRDGAFIDLGGNMIELPDSSKIGGIADVRIGFDLWHHHSTGPAGDYWQWTGGGGAGKIYINSSPGIEGITPNYSNFDELMWHSGARLTFDVPLPDEVKRIVNSGRRVVAVIRAGYALDVSEQERYRLDIDRLFPSGIAWTADMLVADAESLRVRLPVRFNFMMQDPNTSGAQVITLGAASAAIADMSGSGNKVIQEGPGLPIPEFGYGRVLGAVKDRSGGPAWTEADDGLGSRQIYYADGAARYAQGQSPPGPDGPWWLGNLQMETGGGDPLMVLDPRFGERVVHSYENKNYLGKEVSVGVRGGANLMAAVGAMFYYPLEIQFYFAGAENLSVSARNYVSSARPGESVDLEFYVSSSFLQEVETDYTITIDGRAGTDGTLNIPPDGGEAVPFSFAMPDRDVAVRFAVNLGGDMPPQTDMSGNTLELVITVAKPVAMVGDIILDYDVLSQVESFALGETTARLALPALTDARWTGPAEGSLVVTNATPGLYHEFGVEGGARNDAGSFTLEISSYLEEITLDPSISAKIIRDWGNYHDDPLNGDYGQNDAQDAIKPPRAGLVTAEGSVSRPYSYTESYSDRYFDARLGLWVVDRWTETSTGIATADFSSVVNSKSIVVNVYNGMENLPLVKTVRGEAANTAIRNNGVTYNLWWEGAPIQFDVVRWMNHRDLSGNATRWASADGQFARTLTGQSSGSLTWETQLSQEAGYRADRDAARAGRTGRGNYASAVFATDKHLQGRAFPIKSGYYFNPLGQYTCTVKTAQYKETIGPTEEHAELVKLAAASFRYSSDLQYIAAGGNATRFTNLSEANARSVLSVNCSATAMSAARLETTSARTGNVDILLQEAMEGYPASGTDYSRAAFRYRERTDKAVYLVTEETVVTFRIAPPHGANMYTHANMGNGSYAIRVWAEPFTFEGPGENPIGLTTAPSGYFDKITVTVSGSMYDDR